MSATPTPVPAAAEPVDGVDIGEEPTLIIQTVIAILNGVQIGAIPMSTLAHTIVVCLTIALGAVINRQSVVSLPKARRLRALPPV